MKLQSLTIIFIIIILPVTLVLSAYIGYELKTIEKQNLYNTGIISATHDAIFSFEINTNNDEYSNNPEYKRDILKAAVKTFENSFSTTCNLGLYGNDRIEEYIPAIVFGMYDGFYMYAPYQTKENGYKHDLRNYVYYSEQLEGTDIVIRYSLDNYVAISGTLKDPNTYSEEYITKAGYLINTEVWKDELIENPEQLMPYRKYNSQEKEIEYIEGDNKLRDTSAKKYLEDAENFTEWFNTNIQEKVSSAELKNSLIINENNDPEDESSSFVQHKRKIMKDKMQNILNSSITSYAAKTANKYKMPVLTEEEWEKIYTNISVISFVQGMNLGFKKYNSYCVLNSTNSNEYVNPNLLYFSDGTEYHDIRCEKMEDATSIVGYKIGDFEKTKVEVYAKDAQNHIICTLTENGTEQKITEMGTDANGTIMYSNGYTKDTHGTITGSLFSDVSIERKTTEIYYYKHDETACYNCVNGSLTNTTPIYSFVRSLEDDNNTKKAYFTALARERYNTTKLSDTINAN